MIFCLTSCRFTRNHNNFFPLKWLLLVFRRPHTRVGEEAEFTFSLPISLLRFATMYVTCHLSAQTGTNALRADVLFFTIICRHTPACLFYFYDTACLVDTFIYHKNKYVAKGTKQQVMINVWFLLASVIKGQVRNVFTGHWTLQVCCLSAACSFDAMSRQALITQSQSIVVTLITVAHILL